MTTLRSCLRLPIPEIEDAKRLLDSAATAHVAGDFDAAAKLLEQANMPVVRAWTESLWGARSPYAPKKAKASVATARAKERMPSSFLQAQLHGRDGYSCRYCGIPVIRKQIREYFRSNYPTLQIWGRKNVEQHAAFQAMWAQYDHVIPHSAGGQNEIGNLVVTCAPCNFAKMDCTLEEAGLADPRSRSPVITTWDGLERVLHRAAR